ncbi:L,D-transpeptidase family protein [Candidatus Gracilibacteria bacterium]|nr:L,D-transpeptidase family protein [Candidatus Gracilibacteria bacterium]
MSSKKIKRISTLLVASLVGVLVLGAVSTTSAFSSYSEELQTSVLKKTAVKKIKKVTQRVAQGMTSDGTAVTVRCDLQKRSGADYKGEVTARQVNVDAQPGEAFSLSLFVKNVGTAPWFNDTSGCATSPIVHLGTTRPTDRASVFYTPGDASWATRNRIKMVETRVNPGQIATFTIQAKAPKVTDSFKEYFNIVVENTAWLETANETIVVMVHVGEVNDSHAKRAKLLNWSAQASSLSENAQVYVDVDLGEQLARVYAGESMIREFKTSTGAYETPTPTGRFKILSKQELRIGSKSPHYRMPYFQQITPGFVGFHSLPYLENDRGTFWKEALNHIGRRVSHGCIRMLPEDASDLFAISEVGMPVVVHY